MTAETPSNPANAEWKAITDLANAPGTEASPTQDPNVQITPYAHGIGSSQRLEGQPALAADTRVGLVTPEKTLFGKPKPGTAEVFYQEKSRDQASAQVNRELTVTGKGKAEGGQLTVTYRKDFKPVSGYFGESHGSERAGTKAEKTFKGPMAGRIAMAAAKRAGLIEAA